MRFCLSAAIFDHAFQTAFNVLSYLTKPTFLVSSAPLPIFFLFQAGSVGFIFLFKIFKVYFTQGFISYDLLRKAWKFTISAFW